MSQLEVADNVRVQCYSGGLFYLRDNLRQLQPQQLLLMFPSYTAIITKSESIVSIIDSADSIIRSESAALLIERQEFRWVFPHVLPVATAQLRSQRTTTATSLIN